VIDISLLIFEIFEMKNILYVFAIALVMVGCNESKKHKTTAIETSEVANAYQSFGAKIDDKGVLSPDEIKDAYNNLKPGDSIAVKFRSEVNSVCQKKGCWMRMSIGQEEAMVKFKNYGFFMPMDISGQEVIVDGMAFIEEVSVEDQRHFAEDAGKSENQIASITEPKRTLSFTSSGVLIPNKK
jgi:hypothetical protein